MKLEQLANSLELQWSGEADAEVTHLADINTTAANKENENAERVQLAGSLSFVTGKRYAEALKASKATAVIVPEAMSDLAPGNYLVSNNPYLSYAQASQLLYPSTITTGVHSSAVIDETAEVDATASVGPNAVVAAMAKIGADCVIGAGCVIGEGSSVGRGSHLFSNVTVTSDCVIGRDCRIQPGAVIGAEGFGYAPSATGWVRINQVGRVVIGDGVEIGANTTIDRGAIDDTIIEDGVILDNQIQVAHNVRIGKQTAIAGCVGIAGSTRIGERCRIGGKSAIVGHLNIADNVTITAASFVTRSIDEPGVFSSGMPQQESAVWRRNVARLSRLDELFKRVIRIERKLD